MEIDETIARVKQLIAQREQIDLELSAAFAGTSGSRRKPQTCSKCGQEGLPPALAPNPRSKPRSRQRKHNNPGNYWPRFGGAFFF